MDYILPTYYRYSILIVASPENQVPSPSLMIQAAQAPHLVHGESDSAYQMSVPPLGLLRFLNAKHGGAYIQLVGNDSS